MRAEASWQQQLSQLVSSVDELWRLLDLPQSLLESASAAARAFPLRVPQAFVDKIQKGKLDDPLLRQILPQGLELTPPPDFVTDPLAELHANPHRGLLHKYQSRVLIIAGSACAINCRYCFRRHFPYEDNQLSQAQFDELIQHLETHPEVNEVIFSGGDPLINSNARLQRWVDALLLLPQLKRIRFHTRTPVVVPARIDEGLLALFRSIAQSGRNAILVVHSNHPSELDHHFDTAMRKLRDAQVTLFNQAVLLRGVNDHVDAQAALSERLFDAGVLPYYLHLLDPVAGAHDFSIHDTEAFELYRQMAARLPGFLLPRLAREVPGAPAKQILAPNLSE
ncbi:Conserved hypothetical protein [gamma proteobacterium HdN1]|nr:Conserved hypothetical protein [gamma proteobacterium HdN1]